MHQKIQLILNIKKKVDEKNQKKIKEIKHIRNVITENELIITKNIVNKRINELNKNKNLKNVFVVVDFDQFFCAVAQRDDPSLINKPFAIGGIGMISTSNYIARKYGVRSAMPGFIGNFFFFFVYFKKLTLIFNKFS